VPGACISLPRGDSGWRWSAPGSVRGWAGAVQARWWAAPGSARGRRRNSGRRRRQGPCSGSPGDGGGGAGGSWWARATGTGTGRTSRWAWGVAGWPPSARARSGRTASRSRRWRARQAGWLARSAGTGGAARPTAPRPAARQTWRDGRSRDRRRPGPAARGTSGPDRWGARIGHARGMRRPRRVLRAREEPLKKPLPSQLDFLRGLGRIQTHR
jgi:hypothetical protein